MDLSHLTKNEMPWSTPVLSQELMTGSEHSWPPIWKSIKGKLATKKAWRTLDNILEEFFSQCSLNPSLLSFHKIAMLFVFQLCLELNAKRDGKNIFLQILESHENYMPQINLNYWTTYVAKNNYNKALWDVASGWCLFSNSETLCKFSLSITILVHLHYLNWWMFQILVCRGL